MMDLQMLTIQILTVTVFQMAMKKEVIPMAMGDQMIRIQISMEID